jgi:predicted acetyltransferase
MFFLTEPAMTYKDTYLAGVREFQDEGRNLEIDYHDLESNFRRYLQMWHDRSTNPRPGKVAETTFWLIGDEKFIGRLSLRHSLNTSLMQFGGNIGYEIRPSQRRRGYGKLILALGLEKARDINLKRVLVTCDDTNIGSARIIEYNGGVLQNTILLAGRDVPTRRYWIELELE